MQARDTAVRGKLVRGANHDHAQKAHAFTFWPSGWTYSGKLSGSKLIFRLTLSPSLAGRNWHAVISD